jgi:DNA-binding beta-propeller fold protein YncE
VTEETPSSGGFGVGSRIASYRLDEEIGRGGMAVVYRAYDTRLERPVALKVLTPQLAQDEGFRQRFIRESRTAAAVDHPNIIPIFEAGEAGGVLFIAMRYVQGSDVQTLVNADGPLSAARACHIITQVAGALEAAHAHGLVHRDVKPGNMLLDASAGPDLPGHAYLSDFGLSKRALSSSALTSTGQFLGTLDYIAPEQVEARAVDGRTDEYALACSAYTMLTGQPPFVRDESIAVMWAQVSAEPPALTSRRPDLPAAVDEVLARALAKVPADRYATCPQFAAALRRACGLESGGGPALAGPPRDRTTLVPPETFGATAVAAGAAGAAAGQPAGPADRASAGEPAGRAAQPRADSPGPQDSTGEPQGSAGEPQASAGEPLGSAGEPRGSAGEPRESGGPATEQVALGMIGAGGPARPGPRPGAGGSARPGGPGRPRPPGAGPYPAGPDRGPARPGGVTARAHWRSRATIAVGCLAVLAAGGGFFLFGRGGGGATASQTEAALTLPVCTKAVAKAPQLPHVTSQMAGLGGQPFDVATRPGFAFVSFTNGHLAVMSTAKPTPSTLSTDQVPGGSLGEALTPDQSHLVVSGGSGLTVFRVSDLEQGGTATPLGSLTSPGQKHAVEVAVTPDGRFALVTYQTTSHIGVFNLQRALSSGFGPADLVGLIPVAPQPIGITLSPDGRYAYVTSAGQGNSSAGGGLSIVDVRTAEAHPAAAVVKTVAVGCGPSRVITSADGRQVWVTAANSNALLGFSAAKLLRDPQHALLARQAVGAVPLGLTLVDHGARIVVADSDRGNLPSGVADLAVINVAAALAHHPALLGYLPSGQQPRQFALLPGGGTLLVTNTASQQLQAVSLTHLP